ncbi:MAG: hypothetical protein ACRD1X_06635, partial [Vicinamibacteria bacterium]
MTVRYAEQRYLISQREALLLCELLRLEGRFSAPKIAEKIGSWERAVRGDFQNLVKKFLGPQPPWVTDADPEGTVIVTRYKGTRRKEYWITRELRLGTYRQTWQEKIPARSGDVRRFRRMGSVTTHVLTPYKETPMRRLLVDFCLQFAPANAGLSHARLERRETDPD